MNIYLIIYHYSFKKKNKFLLFFEAVLLFLSFMFSPIRIYPFLLFVVLLEFFIWIKIRGLLGLWPAFLRLIVIFSPFIILMLFLPKSTGSYLNGPRVVFDFISYGNYQLLLTPFAGLGYTFLPNDYWLVFGKLSLDNFRDYLSFLIAGPIIIYSILTILLGFLLTKKPTRFILGVVLANIIFEIICYFLITNVRGMVGPNVKGFYEVSTYAVFFGFFVISISFASLFLWLKNRSILLLSLFIGPIFSSVFLWGTWLIIGDSLTFKEGIHWYLIIPPIGTSLFLASLLVIGVKKIKFFGNKQLGYISILCLFLILSSMYLISSREINKTFSYLLSIGYGASDQEEIRSNLTSLIRKPIEAEPALFYLDATENNSVDPLFYPVTLISGFDKRIHFRNWEIVNGCMGLIDNNATLERSLATQDGIKGFKARSLCIEDDFFVDEIEIFYKPENFYALKLKGKDIIDNTKNMLDDLNY